MSCLETVRAVRGKWGNSCSLGAGRGSKSSVGFLRAVLEICLFSVIPGNQGFAESLSEGRESIFRELCSRVSTLFKFSLSLIIGARRCGAVGEVLWEPVQYLPESAESLICYFLVLGTC